MPLPPPDAQRRPVLALQLQLQRPQQDPGEPHPHVHVVLKAVNEQGRRLNIKKATVQEWRAKFAAHLREQGVAANATPRRFRDQPVQATPHALLCQRAREQLAASPRREKGLLLRGAPPLRVKDRELYTKT